jgi:hypothetical protein
MTTIYPMPVRVGGTEKRATEKHNGSTGGAYGELMQKAEEYRNAHPELSIAQAFAKIFTAPDNRELAKRERMESAVK